MRIFLWVLLIAAAAAIVFAISYIEGKVYAKREKDDDRIILEIKALYGLVWYRKDVPLVEFAGWCKGILVKTEEIEDKEEHLQSQDSEAIGVRKILKFVRTARVLLRKTYGLNDWFRQLFARIKCTNLSWNTRIGLEDAPVTAFMVGVVWAIKSTLVGFGHQYVQMKQAPIITVVPQYNILDFSTELLIVGKIRIAYVLMAAMRLFIRITREEGGIAAWRAAIAPDRKVRA
jgi:hypothetical protein